MKTRLFRTAIIAIAATLGGNLGGNLGAQEIDSQCPPGSTNSAGSPDNTMIAQDACQKAIDLFRYVAPQLGIIVAGGNATQGVAGTLGGPGHFSFGIRANALHSSLPEVDRVVPNTRGARIDNYSVDDQAIGFVTADVGVGILGGAAENGFGALDVILSGSYLPEYKSGSFDVAVPASSLKFGLGARLGVLRESATRPAVSVSYLVRALPHVDVVGSSGEDRLFLTDISVRSKSWRAVAGKTFLFLGAAVGYGRDTYDSNASITVTIAPRQATSGGSGGPISLEQKITRRNFFGSAWINAGALKLTGELGQVSGGQVLTYNQFDGPKPDESRNYASVGLSFRR
ncbi:MAG: hypothetical protein ABIS03_04925 [Gemmatimonadaceae bacterium]